MSSNMKKRNLTEAESVNLEHLVADLSHTTKMLSDAIANMKSISNIPSREQANAAHVLTRLLETQRPRRGDHEQDR